MFFPEYLSSIVNCFHFLLFSCAVPVRPKPKARLLCKRSQLVNQVQAHLPQSHRAPVPQVVSRPGQVLLTHQAGPLPQTSKKTNLMLHKTNCRLFTFPCPAYSVVVRRVTILAKFRKRHHYLRVVLFDN